jgi:hypothetical protein
MILLAVILRSIVGILSYPTTMILFWVVMAIVYLQYTRLSAMERQWTGRSPSPLARTMRSLGEGVVGGIAGSLLFVLLGPSIDQMGLGFLWAAALALAILDARLICFSYAAGLACICNLLFGWPKLDVASVTAMVGVLHLIEAGLIWATGSRNAIPVLISGPDGRPAGGFLMERFWPAPVAVGLMLYYPLSAALPEVLAMPDWWPLIKPTVSAPEGMQSVYALVGLTAALGYSDLTYTRLPQQKARVTAAMSCCFSLVLLGLSVLSSTRGWARWLAALFSPVGHELMVHLSRVTEMSGQPVFQTSSRGVVVLDVVRGSPAWQAGMKRGDVIESINCRPILSSDDLSEAIAVSPVAIVIDVRSTLPGASRDTRTVQIRGAQSGLGLCLVPHEGKYPDVRSTRAGLLSIIARRLGARSGRRRM